VNRQAGALVLLTAVVSFLLGLVVAGTRPPMPTTAPLTRAMPEEPPLVLATAGSGPGGATAAGPVDFASVAQAVNPAVVNVDTASRGDESRPRVSRRPAPGDPSGPRQGSGSGFIIDAAGYILTNHHVIAGADRVTVTLSDGRLFRADVVGVDPAIDVALLQVKPNGPLAVVPLGDSEALRVGEWVCAIGNPLGVYAHSVTVGVVSFLGRKLWDQALDAFIQTDAAISVGNSGGPLINARGEVVGITTAVSAQASNIGFAVPIAQVIAILPQLREHGRVARGFIGIGLTAVTPALRHALGLGPERGALVEDVAVGTPAAAAGLRAYDVVVGVDHEAIDSDEALIRYVSRRAPGTLASLKVWRDGGFRTVPVKLRDRPLPDAVRRRAPAAAPLPEVQPLARDHAPLGLVVRDLDQPTAERWRLPDTIQGVIITEVDPTGPARLTSIRTNQILLEINRHRVTSAAVYRALTTGLKPGEAAAILVYNRLTGDRFLSTVILDPAP
jgi:serine protease Do